jgi:hypothetical protein
MGLVVTFVSVQLFLVKNVWELAKSPYLKNKMKTRVVHCKKEKFDIYIGRPSEWGNCFSHKDGTLAQFKVNTRDEAVEKYREWIMRQPQLLARLHELKGKTLACWCKPLACHGDVLAELADKE